MNTEMNEKRRYYDDYNKPRKRRRGISVTNIIHWIITLTLIVVVCLESISIRDIRREISSPSSSVSVNNDGTQYVGEYYCNEWNGKQAILSLRADGTGLYPGGYKMTWEYIDGLLYFYLDNDKNKEHVGTPSLNGISLHDAPFFRY